MLGKVPQELVQVGGASLHWGLRLQSKMYGNSSPRRLHQDTDPSFNSAPFSIRTNHYHIDHFSYHD